jgi:hypothetical protein
MVDFSAVKTLLKAAFASKQAGEPLPSVYPGAKLKLDIAPFVLAGAAGSILPMPPEEVTIESVGRMSTARGINWEHIAFDGGDGFEGFVHLDLLFDDFKVVKEVREVRVYLLFDRITPDDWAVWLDDGRGLIGAPDFQIPSGQVYQRLWTPGTGRIAPVALTETLARTLEGKPRTVERQAMLYARRIAQAGGPTPEGEFLLLSTVETADSAAIEIHVGLAINPSGLSFL